MQEATLLIVDDEPVNLALLTRLLRPEYRVRAARSGVGALQAAASVPRPDLILLDVAMPDMDGFDVQRQLARDEGTRDIPVIFLTALAEPADEERGLRQGAMDYITKPIRPVVLLARVRTQLQARRSRDLMRDQNAFLEAEVGRRMAENDRTQLLSIRALAYLAQTRRSEAGRNLGRMQAFVGELARRLQRHPRFASTLGGGYVDLLTRSAPLHDIGEVGVPDAILRKPGPLTPAEWELMKRHCEFGWRAIEAAERDADQQLGFLSVAKEIARSHHERWDGSGYPDGLAGDAIPISARILALADVFNALLSARVYRPALSLDEARGIIERGRGAQFDPDMSDALLDGFETFAAIAERHRELPAATAPAPLP